MTRDDEAQRYRKAAHMTLDQLDWCAEYLRRLGKRRISKQIAGNRSAIAARLSPREDDAPERVSRRG
jgi:hypothetical protein